MKLVTDPEILRQLEGQEQQGSESLSPESDDAVLKELEADTGKSGPSDVGISKERLAQCYNSWRAYFGITLH